MTAIGPLPPQRVINHDYNLEGTRSHTLIRPSDARQMADTQGDRHTVSGGRGGRLGQNIFLENKTEYFPRDVTSPP